MKYFYYYWLTLLTAFGASLLYWQPSRTLCALVATLAWLSLFIPWLFQRCKQPPASQLNPDMLCVAYASQGGQAKALAQRSLTQLQAAGLDCQLRDLADLQAADWRNLKQLLIIASTYGEGEAPDHAASCEHLLMHSKEQLPQLDYAVLALGDRSYPHFCAFGRRLDQRLRSLGANPIQDCLYADRSDPAVLRQWQQLLAQLSDCNTFSDWATPDYQQATLLERQCLNPNSQGNPAYLIGLTIPSNCTWQAGDILEVGPCNSTGRLVAFALKHRLNLQQKMPDGQTLEQHLSRRQLDFVLPEQTLSAAQLLEQLPLLAHRDYSIASLPSSGQLQLLVRLHKHSQGLGCASGWLCKYAEIGTTLEVKVRTNPNFQLPTTTGSLILIGNGTGIAGLQSHLREREALGQHGHWLIFGERQAAHDHFFANEHQQWLASGHLSRLDLVFSREQSSTRYVQHLLRNQADELRKRLEQGASLLVCGSLKGMGQEIDDLLHGLLGAEKLQALRDAGRYRRDLY